MKFFKKVKKGFTLVELVVVIAVVAILAAVSVGAYFGIVESAKETKLKQEAEQIHLAMRIISLDGDPNQTLKRDGLLISDGGLDEFENQLSNELGWDGLEVTLQEPTEVKEKLVYLYTENNISAQDNSEILYVYFNYYTREALGKKAKVNIIGGEDIGVSASDVTLAKHECGIHTVDVSGNHSLLECKEHYACEAKNVESHNTICDHCGKYKCEGSEHDEASNCIAMGYFDKQHVYACQCLNIVIPKDTILEIHHNDNIHTYVEGDTFTCLDWYNYLITLNGSLRAFAYYGQYRYPVGFTDLTCGVEVGKEYKNEEYLEDPLDEILGIPVVYADDCFKGCTNLIKAPKLPDDIRSYARTFSQCRSLVDISNFTINPNVDDVNLYETFYGCDSLINMNLDLSNALDMSNFVSGSEELIGSVTLGEQISGLFYSFSSVKYMNIIIPDNFKNIFNLIGTFSNSNINFINSSNKASVTLNFWEKLQHADHTFSWSKINYSEDDDPEKNSELKKDFKVIINSDANCNMMFNGTEINGNFILEINKDITNYQRILENVTADSITITGSASNATKEGIAKTYGEDWRKIKLL